MNKITITVQGKPNSGKRIVVNQIKNLLSQHGYNVQNIGGEERLLNNQDTEKLKNVEFLILDQDTA